MNQNFPRRTIDIEIDEDILIDFIVVEEVMRVDLVGPFGAPRIGIAGEDHSAPEVIAAALVGIPWARIGGAVIDQVEFGIVGDPAPDRAAPNLPAIRGPTGDAEILAL